MTIQPESWPFVVPPGKQAVHDLSAARDDRADLLAIDELGSGRAAMADKAGNLLDRNARVREQRDEAVP